MVYWSTWALWPAMAGYALLVYLGPMARYGRPWPDKDIPVYSPLWPAMAG